MIDWLDWLTGPLTHGFRRTRDGHDVPGHSIAGGSVQVCVPTVMQVLGAQVAEHSDNE